MKSQDIMSRKETIEFNRLKRELEILKEDFQFWNDERKKLIQRKKELKKKIDDLEKKYEVNQ